MSLHDLLANHLDPRIKEQEILLGHSLHSSLDNDSQELVGELASLKTYLQRLLAFRSIVHVTKNQVPDAQTLSALFEQAHSLKLNVKYTERVVKEDKEVRVTKLQSKRKRKTKPKPKAKAKAKLEAEVETEPEPEVVETVTAPAPAPAPAPTKPVTKVKAKPRPKAHKWGSNKYGEEGKASGLKFNFSKYKRAIESVDQEQVDAVIHSIISASQPYSDQLSSVDALSQYIEGEITPEMVALHKKLKRATEDSV